MHRWKPIFWTKYCVYLLVTQSCLTLCNPMDCSPPRLLCPGVLQARILPSSRGSSQPRDWTRVSCIAGRFFTVWATREANNYYQVAQIRLLFFFTFLKRSCNFRRINAGNLPRKYVKKRVGRLTCPSRYQKMLLLLWVTKSCLTICGPMDCSTPGFPVLHYFLDFTQTHVQLKKNLESGQVLSLLGQGIALPWAYV